MNDPYITHFTYEGRTTCRRWDLRGEPMMIVDACFAEPAHRRYTLAHLVLADTESVPVPTVIRARFPYARSVRGQIRWKPAWYPLRGRA